MKTEIQDIVKQFDIQGELVKTIPMTSGHINTTFCIHVRNGENLTPYTLQEINKYVFKNPPEVMENIINVTEHIKKKAAERGENVSRACLTVVPVKETGLPYLLDDNGDYWRVYEFIDNAYTVDSANDLDLIKSAGEGFGKFQSMLADFPMDLLHETIPHFHNTSIRYDQLMDAYNEDIAGRAHNVKEDIAFFRKRHDEMCSHVKLCSEGKLPLRVTHNDTKFNNILIDEDTHKALCAIDLDTVMPGLSVNDFGDAIRFAANNAAEDERDLSKVYINMDLYNAFSDGFLSQLDGRLTRTEIENMPLAAKIITMEIASRFLADYLNGDKYFKIDYPEHNLVRARCQIKLALSMEENFEKMQEVIKKFL